MNRVHKLMTSFAAFAAFTVCASSPAMARPAYSRKRDKVVDVPMQFTATVVGGRVELSASGGSDRSGWIATDEIALRSFAMRRSSNFRCDLTFSVSNRRIHQRHDCRQFQILILHARVVSVNANHSSNDEEQCVAGGCIQQE